MAKKITKQINSQFQPTFIDGIPQYGFGSWLKENAGTIGTVAGAGLGMLVGMPTVGATIGGSIGGAVQGNYEQDQAKLEQQKQLNTNAALQQVNPQQQYQSLMAMGGYTTDYAKGGSLNFKSNAAYKKWLAYGHASGEFSKTPGYQKVSIKGQSKDVKHGNGGNLNDTVNINNGSTHESSSLGGVPLGKNALVEQDEVIFESPKRGRYVFSNRF